MLILFLDDQDIRHESAERHFSKDHTVLHAFNADEAISILMSCQERVGLAMLDHDLQDFTVDDDGNNYERHGVYFIERMFKDVPKDKWPAQFILHSYNPNGVNNMRQALTNLDQTVYALQFSGDNLNIISERIRVQ